MRAKLRRSDGLASAKAVQVRVPVYAATNHFCPLMQSRARACSVDAVVSNQCLMNTVGFAEGY
jgi:hypothetical protein